MEDAVLDDFPMYDPAKANVVVDGTAVGTVLPHLMYATKGSVAAKACAFSKDGRVRVQVLSDRLVRVERDPGGCFEDRASFCFTERGNAPGAAFETQNIGEGGLVVTTKLVEVTVDALDAECAISAKVFEKDGKLGTKKVFCGTMDGVPLDDGDLGGTCRTLDEADGYFMRHGSTGCRTPEVFLRCGLLSRGGKITFVDDTKRPVFTEDGWFTPREPRDGYIDCYALASGEDYISALTAFSDAAGTIPMIPRRYLGNWWSRYYAYEQVELRELMLKFAAYRLPLSMLIIDMDWHPVTHEDGVARTSNGWTGYSWNKRLFPDSSEFIQWLHDRDIGTSLNLHPAAGVHSHEDGYRKFGEYIGAVARNTGEPIPFDPTDPMSVSAYFKCLIHPLEEGAGDFAKWSWWLDWQQGGSSRMTGVDPLFLVNHVHYLDMARGSPCERRPVVFSRFAGHGSHRTPIGFSGDTYVTWASLAFQSYLTPTASNAAFPYWSHDIGGHMRGVHDDALYARWVQSGVLSPIMRLHSSNNPFLFRMPWSFSLDACEAACNAMRMRHALVPYIYSRYYDTFKTCTPLVMPMYYTHPNSADAYAAPAQYWFGSELIVAPFTSPPNPDTKLSRQAVWLPSFHKGQDKVAWRHLLSGEAYSPGWHSVYGGLNDNPIFAPIGAIVPMAQVPESTEDVAEFNSVANPKFLDIHVVAGGSGEFALYEDEEVGQRRAFVTQLSCSYEAGCMEVSVEPPQKVESKKASVARNQDTKNASLATESDITGVIPATRSWKLRLLGVGRLVTAQVFLGPSGSNSDAGTSLVGDYDRQTESMTFLVANCPSTQRILLRCSCEPGNEFLSSTDRTEKKVMSMLETFNLGTEKKWDLLKILPELMSSPLCLKSVGATEEVTDTTGTLFTVTPAMKLALLETIEKCGFARNYLSRPCAPAVFWSGPNISVSLAVRSSGSDEVDELTLSNEETRILYAPGSNETEFATDITAPSVMANGVVASFEGIVTVDIPMRDPNDDDGDPAITFSD